MSTITRRGVWPRAIVHYSRKPTGSGRCEGRRAGGRRPCRAPGGRTAPRRNGAPPPGQNSRTSRFFQTQFKSTTEPPVFVSLPPPPHRQARLRCGEPFFPKKSFMIAKPQSVGVSRTSGERGGVVRAQSPHAGRVPAEQSRQGKVLLRSASSTPPTPPASGSRREGRVRRKFSAFFSRGKAKAGARGSWLRGARRVGCGRLSSCGGRCRVFGVRVRGLHPLVSSGYI